MLSRENDANEAIILIQTDFREFNGRELGKEKFGSGHGEVVYITVTVGCK